IMLIAYGFSAREEHLEKSFGTENGQYKSCMAQLRQALFLLLNLVPVPESNGTQPPRERWPEARRQQQSERMKRYWQGKRAERLREAIAHEHGRLPNSAAAIREDRDSRG